MPDPLALELNDKQREFIDGLYELARFLDNRPGLCPEHGLSVYICRTSTTDLEVSLHDLGGSCGHYEKFVGHASWVGGSRTFGPHTVTVYSSHETIGSKQVRTGEIKTRQKAEYTYSTETYEESVWEPPAQFR
jgi:hypothetical protein